jgi:hypothetical protein
MEQSILEMASELRDSCNKAQTVDAGDVLDEMFSAMSKPLPAWLSAPDVLLPVPNRSAADMPRVGALMREAGL